MNRRTLLKGIGGAFMTLPWLELNASVMQKNNQRLAWIFMPNGYIPDRFKPTEDGKDYTLPTCLEPLKDLRSQFSIYSGLALQGNKGGGHKNCASLLTDGTRSRDEIALQAGFSENSEDIISADQLAARYLGANSFIDSMHFSSTSNVSNRSPDSVGDHPEYFKYISWKSSKEYIVQDRDPYMAFKRLYGSTSASRVSENQMKSVLDLTRSDLKRLVKYAGREDRSRLDQYFTSIRTLEKRMEKMNKDSGYSKTIPADYRKPEEDFAMGLGQSWRNTNYFDELQQMYCDLFVLAFQTRRTNVITYMFAQEATRQSYSFLESGIHHHHGASHYGTSAKHTDSFTKIIQYQVGLYAQILERLSNIKEGDKSILDNSQIMLTACIGDGQNHKGYDLPCIIAGKGGGKHKTGLHLKSNIAERKPLSSAHLAMLQAAGINAPSFGYANEALF
ncbi:DUF1552 domain-containing protein [Lentisphaera profundi]|uniref:DUF1552 domain-containing protein n=1 Tax=Lentisphaera profundi TaxID=1658616 RepID=A0ABY7VT55_9BACT|nr:DUF1552 domain-containing protein [Lentisphaera profundi]WDE97400.1 DUF1552 domain-containing protein [Lentisphaera profundi]